MHEHERIDEFYWLNERDNPKVAEEELRSVLNPKKRKLSQDIKFRQPSNSYSSRPKIAILREQGINGQTEMAAAFHQAYFDPYDVHMSDLTTKEKNLKDIQKKKVTLHF